MEVYIGCKLDDGSYEKMWVGGYQEGQCLGDIYVYKVEGLYRSEFEILGNLIDKFIGNNSLNNKILYGLEVWVKLIDQEKSKGLFI